MKRPKVAVISVLDTRTILLASIVAVPLSSLMVAPSRNPSPCTFTLNEKSSVVPWLGVIEVTSSCPGGGVIMLKGAGFEMPPAVVTPTWTTPAGCQGALHLISVLDQEV